MSGPVANYDSLIVELIAKAHNAARRNKPTMWAYYLEAARGLQDWFVDVDRTDGDYGEAATALSGHAQANCADLNAGHAARLWALGIYARRITRGWSRSRRPSLQWLHRRADVLVEREDVA